MIHYVGLAVQLHGLEGYKTLQEVVEKVKGLLCPEFSKRFLSDVEVVVEEFVGTEEEA